MKLAWKILVPFVLVLLVSLSPAENISEAPAYRAHGLSIQPPMPKEVRSYPYTMAMFYLPPSDGFSANVNIQKQVFVQDMEAYDQISKSQFEEMGAKLLRGEVRDNEALYEGTVTANNGQRFHIFSRAVKDGNFVYLVTATALERHWPEQKAELMQSVNSFRLAK